MEDETGDQVRTSRRELTAIVAIFLGCVLGSVGLYLVAGDTYSENQIRRLIQTPYNSQRPGGGRLSGAPYSLPAAVPNTQSERSEEHTPELQSHSFISYAVFSL